MSRPQVPSVWPSVCCRSVLAIVDFSGDGDISNYRRLLGGMERPTPVVVEQRLVDGGIVGLPVREDCRDPDLTVLSDQASKPGVLGIVIELASVDGGIVAQRSADYFRPAGSHAISLNGDAVWLPPDFFDVVCSARPATGTEWEEAAR